MQNHNPVEIVKSVRKNLSERNRVISLLYKDDGLKNLVTKTLIKMGCQPNDVHQYYTEAIVNFMQSCYKPDFAIKSSLGNYLTGTAKNLWLKEVTKNARRRTIEDSLEKGYDDSVEILLIEKEKKKLLEQVLNQLDATCKTLLNLWALRKKMKEIASTMSYKSEGMARKKKHQCLKRLYAIIDNLPNLRQELSSI